MTGKTDTPKAKGRWLRFSLRTLLVVMLLLGVVFGVLAWMAREATRQRHLVADLEELGADIAFLDQEPSMPKWLDTACTRRVKRIGLVYSQVTDISPLAELNNLEELHLSGTQVADVSPLAELKTLVYLDLDGTQVADVSPLVNLKYLEKLILDGTPVSHQQMNQLAQALPNCKIIR